MIRNLKVLGLALIAMLAMTAVAAQAASAHEFKSESANTDLKGVDEAGTNHIFTAGGFAEVECESATFTGSQSGVEADTVQMHPAYAECAFFGEEATVDTTGCDYIFDSDTDGNGHAAVTVTCSGSNTIEIITSACTLEIGSQLVGQGVSYANISGGDVTVDATATSIDASSWEGPLCFLLESEGGITGVYDGLATVSGFVGGTSNPTNIAVE